MTTVGYIRADEFSDRTSNLPNRHFDLLLCVGSWENRCLALKSWRGLTSDRSMILRFASRRDDTIKDKNIKDLDKELRARSECQLVHLSSTTQISKAFDALGEEMTRFAKRIGRKLRLCVDISTMPRSLISYILLMGFRTKIIDQATLFYAISDHTETLKLVAGTGDSSRSPHVEGNWNLISIPYGEGIVKSSRYDQIVVSVGLDTYQIIDVLDKREPWASIFLMPHRGDESSMDKLAEERFDKIRTRYASEFKSGRFRELVVRPYELSWTNGLSSLMKETFVREDASTLFYPFGPKIHSVGLSLLALQDEQVAIIGRTPSSYFQRSVDATEFAHIIDLVDLSSTTSMLFRKYNFLETLGR
jgi:hypothetical protein